MPRGKPFQPGSDERRNAGGRPKEVGHVKELAKEQTEAAIATLMEIHADKTQPAPARVAAATALLDRAWGKPSQAVDMTSKGERMGYVIPVPPEVEDAAAWATRHKPH